MFVIAPTDISFACNILTERWKTSCHALDMAIFTTAVTYIKKDK